MKLSKRNALFTLVAAVLLGWGIFYTNCGTQQDGMSGAVDENDPKSIMTRAIPVGCTTGVGAPSAGFAAIGCDCEIWYHCPGGVTYGIGGNFYPVNGNSQGMCCRPGFADCTFTNGVVIQSDGGNINATSPTSTSPITTTSPTTKTK